MFSTNICMLYLLNQCMKTEKIASGCVYMFKIKLLSEMHDMTLSELLNPTHI